MREWISHHNQCMISIFISSFPTKRPVNYDSCCKEGPLIVVMVAMVIASLNGVAWKWPHSNLYHWLFPPNPMFTMSHAHDPLYIGPRSVYVHCIEVGHFKSRTQTYLLLLFGNLESRPVHVSIFIHLAICFLCCLIPAPSKGCQLNPKGWWIDTL